MDKKSIILEHLCRQPEASQRDLARVAGMSLGQINLFMKNFHEDGFIRREAVSKKRVRYMLTQRGHAERVRRSNERILSIIRDYKRIKDSIGVLLRDLYSKGYREFILEGESDDVYEVISDIFEVDLKGKATLMWGPAEEKNDRVVLNLDRRFASSSKTLVNVLNEISL